MEGEVRLTVSRHWPQTNDLSIHLPVPPHLVLQRATRVLGANKAALAPAARAAATCNVKQRMRVMAMAVGDVQSLGIIGIFQTTGRALPPTCADRSILSRCLSSASLSSSSSS